MLKVSSRIVFPLLLLLLATDSLGASGEPFLVEPAVPGSLAAPSKEICGPPRESLKELVIYTRSEGNLSLYNKLNYITLGGNDAKLQFSFKYRPVDSFNLFFAYTNLIIWDVFEDSQPYRDINFTPEVFYRFENGRTGPLSFDVGYWHSSNGQDGADSRTWDRFSLRFNALLNVRDIDFYWLTSFYQTASKGHQNEDISQYLGFWETSLYASRILGRHEENLDLQIVIRSGEHGDFYHRGSVELGAKYRLNIVRWDPYLYLQYFKGYAETLLHYNQENEELRAGLAFFY